MLMVSIIIPIAIYWSMSLEMWWMLIFLDSVYAQMSAIFFWLVQNSVVELSSIVVSRTMFPAMSLL
jgi:hypothetical protein